MLLYILVLFFLLGVQFSSFCLSETFHIMQMHWVCVPKKANVRKTMRILVISDNRPFSLFITYGNLSEHVQEWRCVRRILEECEKTPRKQGSKHGFVLRMCFPAPPRCSKLGWVCFRLQIALTFVIQKYFQGWIVLVTVYSLNSCKQTKPLPLWLNIAWTHVNFAHMTLPSLRIPPQHNSSDVLNKVGYCMRP